MFFNDSLIKPLKFFVCTWISFKAGEGEALKYVRVWLGHKRLLKRRRMNQSNMKGFALRSVGQDNRRCFLEGYECITYKFEDSSTIRWTLYQPALVINFNILFMHYFRCLFKAALSSKLGTLC